MKKLLLIATLSALPLSAAIGMEKHPSIEITLDPNVPHTFPKEGNIWIQKYSASGQPMNSKRIFPGQSKKIELDPLDNKIQAYCQDGSSARFIKTTNGSLEHIEDKAHYTVTVEKFHPIEQEGEFNEECVVRWTKH